MTVMNLDWCGPPGIRTAASELQIPLNRTISQANIQLRPENTPGGMGIAPIIGDIAAYARSTWIAFRVPD